MKPRTIGVEEEFLLVDPATRKVSPVSQHVLQRAHGEQPATSDEDLDKELFRHQLETRTPPDKDLGELREHLVRQRRAAGEAAELAGVATIASGTSPVASGEPRVTRVDRYLTMLETYGEIARVAGICGMHVHVEVDSEEQGVAVIDRLSPWLPVVLAISANSPYVEGRDTGYHSWRSRVWAQWPSAGPAEQFGSLAAYREVSGQLIASGAALDRGMIYFDARLSEANPTVEVRTSDVCTDPDDAVLIAALVRGLVMRAADSDVDGSEPVWRAELLRAAHWRAARYGLSNRLLSPITAEPVPAREVLALLFATVRDQLEACGDVDLVSDGLERVLAGGGASRQHAAYERSGGDLAAVVDDLVVRTNACWHT
ncbi:carboxylate-amine ligase [Nocardioides bizhenqiangii]|uniref:Putative glutamate--cysteine ligase 2 n=1 Tax=Nocardioides bizhenqiangii TaxID=3095076 RepID=A0ABZ0ZS95_9ACTN|nr:glutamate--cysteine ligase [Nocardioides sp. HM61]WQQ26764.1 glutamate--cysteine ligase [Nocardioides sp. HM61]